MEIIELFEKCEKIKTELEVHQDALALRTKKLLIKVVNDILKLNIDVVFIDNLNYDEHIVFYDDKGLNVSFSFLVPVSIEEDEKEILQDFLDYIFVYRRPTAPSRFNKKRIYNVNEEAAIKLLELSELTKDAAILLIKLRS